MVAMVILEQPLPTIMIGMLLAVICLIGLLRTGLVRFLYFAIGIAAITVALVFVERVVVTPKEEIEGTLATIARDLESNDRPRILSHIATSSQQLRVRAERALKPIVVHRVSVKNNLMVTFDTERNPRSAQATFNAVVVGSERSGSVQNQMSPWFFIVDFVKEGDRWRVADYARRSPQEGLRSRR